MAREPLVALGETGILFVDLSGYSQVVYHCVEDAARLERLALALSRLFRDPKEEHPDVTIEGYAGDGFLALCSGKTPARSLYDYAKGLHARFAREIRSLLMNLGFRVDVSLRTGLHIGAAWRYAIDPARTSALISDAANVASRVGASQTCRRTGLAMTRGFFRRLLRAGDEQIRGPDEVIQDRNQYPEPIEIYTLHPEEERRVADAAR
ncbi:MAG: hypothetical protein ACT4PV_05115 [Planctomycetaceae bacterium]